MKRFFGSADDAARAIKQLRLVKVLGPIGTGLTGLEQWLSDSGYEIDKRIGRAAGAMALDYGAGAAIIAGATAIGGPLGLAVGVVGVGGWYLVTEHTDIDEGLVNLSGVVGDHVGNAVSSAAHGISHGAQAAANAGQAMINKGQHAAGTVAHGVGNAAHSAANAISFWK